MNLDDKWYDPNLMCINKLNVDISLTNLSTVNFNEGTSSKEIGVDKVRKIIEFSQLKSINDSWRIVIIDAVDDLSYNAANCLLKLLEEPPCKLLLILINHCTSRVLPTIRSRCLKMNFSPIDIDDISKWFNNYAPNIRAVRRENLIKLGAGQIGKVKNFFNNNVDEYYSNFCYLLAQSPKFPDKLQEELNVTYNNIEGRVLIWQSINLLMTRVIYNDTQLLEGEALLFPKIKKSPKLIDNFLEIESLLHEEKQFNLDPKQTILISLNKIVEHIR